MYTVLGFEILFHKIIEENWKQFCIEISYSLKKRLFLFTLYLIKTSFVKWCKLQFINFKFKSHACLVRICTLQCLHEARLLIISSPNYFIIIPFLFVYSHSCFVARSRLDESQRRSSLFSLALLRFN
jgi:hypothetical protein